MGHHITAIVARGAADGEIAEEFDTTVVELEQGFVLIPLDAWQSDHWSEQLGLGYGTDEAIFLDDPFAHMLAGKAIESDTIAIINTDYNAGVGSQSAVVYSKGLEIMPAEVTPVERVQAKKDSPINKALRLLGAEADKGKDEFESLGINNYRDFDDLFEKLKDL